MLPWQIRRKTENGIELLGIVPVKEHRHGDGNRYTATIDNMGFICSTVERLSLMLSQYIVTKTGIDANDLLVGPMHDYGLGGDNS